jgi:hypothetical protein
VLRWLLLVVIALGPGTAMQVMAWGSMAAQGVGAGRTAAALRGILAGERCDLCRIADGLRERERPAATHPPLRWEALVASAPVVAMPPPGSLAWIQPRSRTVPGRTPVPEPPIPI